MWLWYREENINGLKNKDISKGMNGNRFKTLARQNGLSCESFRLNNP